MMTVRHIEQHSSCRQLLHRAPLSVSILCSCWAIAQAAPSVAQEVQPLFPPTNTIPSVETVPQRLYESESYPSFPATGNVPQTPANPFNSAPRTVPNFSAVPNIAATLYRVEIAGGDPFLLDRVQTIVPEAFFRSGDGTIQAGSFAEASNAQQRLQLLASQGIAARVVPVSRNSIYTPSYPAQVATSYPVQPTTNYSPSYPQNAYPTTAANPGFLSPNQRNEEDNRGFFVVIPGRQEELNQIAIQLIELGMRPSAIQERSQPRGWHIAVGPFVDREAADTWNALFRSEGLDARLYFQ